MPEFSEFSYGYAVTEYLVKRIGPPLHAPTFPSLFAEGTVGGFDVELDLPGIPLFLQFKLSDCMTRRNAWETRHGFLHSPFYRVYLRPLKYSQQHNLLLDLEARGNEVYYIAPAFHRKIEFDTAYLTGKVVSKSVFIRPSSIGHLRDDWEHHVSFKNESSKFGYFFSELPMRVKMENWERVYKDAKTKCTKQKRAIRDHLFRTEEIMQAIIQERVKFKEGESFAQPEINENPAHRVASLSLIYFDCAMFVIQF
jgi:hypothetical protein